MREMGRASSACPGLDMDPGLLKLCSDPRRAQTNETWQGTERRQLRGRCLFHCLRVVAKDMQASGSGRADCCRLELPDSLLIEHGLSRPRADRKRNIVQLGRKDIAVERFHLVVGVVLVVLVGQVDFKKLLCTTACLCCLAGELR